MSTRVLLSLKPQFADAILEGRKRFEFRKALYRRTDVTRIVLYASSPVQRVVGEFEVDTVLSMAPDDLWHATWKGAGITRGYFDDYFGGREVGHALGVRLVKRYVRPRRLLQDYGVSFPPQSFMYLD